LCRPAQDVNFLKFAFLTNNAQGQALSQWRWKRVPDPAAEDELTLLVQACQAGDAAAADRMVVEFWPIVFRFAYRLSGDQNEAEDLAQETFLKAILSIDQFEPTGAFKSWLFRIASNLFLDRRKSSWSQRVVGGEDFSGFTARGTGKPEDEALARETYNQLQHGIEALSHEQQVVLTLRTVEGMSYTDIAQIMQVSEVTVRWHLFEARKSLRKSMGMADKPSGV
jgi:RNA polymerase sigma-70 factor (ECF subfamily)